MKTKIKVWVARDITANKVCIYLTQEPVFMSDSETFDLRDDRDEFLQAYLNKDSKFFSDLKPGECKEFEIEFREVV